MPVRNPQKGPCWNRALESDATLATYLFLFLTRQIKELVFASNSFKINDEKLRSAAAGISFQQRRWRVEKFGNGPQLKPKRQSCSLLKNCFPSCSISIESRRQNPLFLYHRLAWDFALAFIPKISSATVRERLVLLLHLIRLPADFWPSISTDYIRGRKMFFFFNQENSG